MFINSPMYKKFKNLKTTDWSEEKLKAEFDLIENKVSTLPSALRREIVLHYRAIEAKNKCK